MKSRNQIEVQGYTDRSPVTVFVGDRSVDVSFSLRIDEDLMTCCEDINTVAIGEIAEIAGQTVDAVYDHVSGEIERQVAEYLRDKPARIHVWLDETSEPGRASLIVSLADGDTDTTLAVFGAGDYCAAFAEAAKQATARRLLIEDRRDS